MERSKNMKVMKALVEESLRRRYVRSGCSKSIDEEIELGMKMLNILLPAEGTLLVIADSHRFVRDFSIVVKRPCVHIQGAHHIAGQENRTVVVLHTGSRTFRQTENYEQTMCRLAVCRDMDVWHIGEWR